MNKLINIFRLFRCFEAAVFTGVPVMGIALSIYYNGLPQIGYLRVLLYISAIYLLAVHVFMMNGYADYHRDIRDSNKLNHSRLLSGSSTGLFFASAIITGLLSLSLLLIFSVNSFLIGVILVILSLAYSTSTLFVHGKGLPGLSSLLHLTGGILAYILGYILFGQLHIQVLLSGLVFGLFITAGHLFQEIQDLQGDKTNNIKTLTIILGHKNSFVIAVILIMLAHVLISFLMIHEIFPDLIMINFIVLIAVMLFAMLTFFNGLNYKNINRFRLQYRIVYAFFALILILNIYFNNHIYY